MDREMEDPFPFMVCAFLPQIPNVRIKSFKVAEHNSIQESAEYREIMNTIINHEASVSNHETCFMLFCNLEGRTIAKRWARAVQKRYNLYSKQYIYPSNYYVQLLYNDG